MFPQICSVKQGDMKTLLIFIITFLALQVNAMPKDSVSVVMNTSTSNSQINIRTNSQSQKADLINNTRFEFFNVSTDWLLETKAELINGISYSPTLEFNISRPNGFNFQVQTGALPIINGLKVQKTQPAAGLSFSYKF